MHSAESGETINTQSTMDDLKASANEGKPNTEEEMEDFRGAWVRKDATYREKMTAAVKAKNAREREWHSNNISYFHTEGWIMRRNGENLWRVMVPDNSKYGHDHMAVTEEEAKQIVADHYADPNWKDCELALCPDARPTS
tara:strand:+ start:567 stop:986 length:420 start_codon:yes stop_codon:yes gene_type:complete